MDLTIHPCKLCGIKFDRKYDLLQHFKTHLGKILLISEIYRSIIDR